MAPCRRCRSGPRGPTAAYASANGCATGSGSSPWSWSSAASSQPSSSPTRNRRTAPGVGPRARVRTSTADTMLGAMSSSMLTFVGVVFAITLVGLQLASSQLSPRVIRTFVRSVVTKVAFGYFLATFAYAVTGLGIDEVTDPATASGRWAPLVVLAVAVGVFVVYVTATMRLLEVGWVITAVANEARAAIRRALPPAEAYVAARRADSAEHPRVVHLQPPRRAVVPALLGTVLAVDRRPRQARRGARLRRSRSCRAWGSTSPPAGRAGGTRGPDAAGRPLLLGWSTSVAHALSTRTRPSASGSWSTSRPRRCRRRSTSRPPRSWSSTGCTTCCSASPGFPRRPACTWTPQARSGWSSRRTPGRISCISRSRRSPRWGAPRPM